MRALIEQAFSDTLFQGCIETCSDIEFGITDPPGQNKCYVEKELTNLVHFTIKNPNQKEIHFLAIDHCLASSSDPQRCDCAVFDESTFCFVEIKVVNRPNQRKKARKDAKEQLLRTIHWFKEKIDFGQTTLEAHLCVGTTQNRPKITSSDIVAAAKFNDLGVTLYDDNEQTFE